MLKRAYACGGRLVAAAAAAVLLAAARPAAGQVLRARLLDAGTDAPIPAAFAILEQTAAGSARAAAGLSDGQGWVQLRATLPGPFVLRVERLGYRTFVSEPFALDSMEVRQLRITAEAIHLPAITAEGKRRCGGVSALAAEAAVLWDEVRKALAVNSWTAAEGSVFYVVREYRRRLDLRTFAVLEEQSEQNTVWTTGSPFVSLGARELSEGGFVRVSREGAYQYYGPDSEVILSEWFQERHCFRAVAHGRDSALIGLGFEPGPGAPRFDIRGVLWLDRASAELRTLEYSYTALPVTVERRAAGGELRFERLPSGRWIVRSWWIRAPILRRSGARDPLVAGVQEAGREVVSLTERRRGGNP